MSLPPSLELRTLREPACLSGCSAGPGGAAACLSPRAAPRQACMHAGPVSAHDVPARLSGGLYAVLTKAACMLQVYCTGMRACVCIYLGSENAIDQALAHWCANTPTCCCQVGCASGSRGCLHQVHLARHAHKAPASVLTAGLCVHMCVCHCAFLRGHCCAAHSVFSAQCVAMKCILPRWSVAYAAEWLPAVVLCSCMCRGSCCGGTCRHRGVVWAPVHQLTSAGAASAALRCLLGWVRVRCSLAHERGCCCCCCNPLRAVAGCV